VPAHVALRTSSEDIIARASDKLIKPRGRALNEFLLFFSSSSSSSRSRRDYRERNYYHRAVTEERPAAASPVRGYPRWIFAFIGHSEPDHDHDRQEKIFSSACSTCHVEVKLKMLAAARRDANGKAAFAARVPRAIAMSDRRYGQYLSPRKATRKERERREREREREREDA